MRHKRLGRKLGVTTKHRRSMLRNMVTDFLRHEKIKTTDTRAKELRRLSEKMITLAKEGSLHSRRKAAEIIRDKTVLKKLFEEIAQKFKDRPGGYTRIIKLGYRRGDNAPISLIELVAEELKPKAKKRAKKKEDKPKAERTKVVATKSRKKEAAEDLGLIERKEKTESEGGSSDFKEATEAGQVIEGVKVQSPESKESIETEASQAQEASKTEMKISDERVSERSPEGEKKSE